MAAKKLNIDTGIQEFQIGGGGVLRFNPADPNVFNRFLGATEAVGRIDEEFAQRAKELPEGDGEGALRLLADADRKIKAVLNEIFGGGNDFDRILSGVNVMAAGANGQRIISNIFEALTPIFAEGAQKCADAKLETAKANREQRRKAAKK